MLKKLVFLVVTLTFCFLTARPTLAIYNFVPASSPVLFQPDLISNSLALGVSSSTINNSNADFVTTDGTHLFVSDGLNSRVLIWNSIPTSNQQPADLVLGQTTFTGSSANAGGSASASTLSSPRDIFFYQGKLIVADQSNHRVLIWNSVPTTSFQAADVVVGQPDMLTVTAGTSAIKMSDPYSISAYDGKLFVGEVTNNRVLIFNSIPTSNGATANVVVGQTDFITATPGGATATGFGTAGATGPRGVEAAEGKLIVADGNNNRVLVFNPIPTSNGASASAVIGQTSFTGAGSDAGGISCASMNGPNGVRVLNHRLYIGDTSRLAVFNRIPTTTFPSAEMVLGQPDCATRTANFGGVSASTLNGVTRSLTETGNKLIVADSNNRRILFFNNVVSTPKINLNSAPESFPDGRLRLKGFVRLGGRPNYRMQMIRASVNGQGYTDVTSRTGDKSNGDLETDTEFSHDFEPWSGISSRDEYIAKSKGYTVSVYAFSYNADEEYAFYFSPFEFKSATSGNLPTFTFSVNSDQWGRVAANIAEYEVQVKKEGAASWETYLDNIPASSSGTNAALLTTYDTTTGQITVKSKIKSLASGKYQVKVVAIDRWGHGQDSPILTLSTTGASSSVVRPILPITTTWYPLTLGKVNGSILSSVTPELVKPTYSTGTYGPRFEGIAFSGSTVTLVVSDTKSKRQKIYTATAVNSKWAISPTLDGSSVIDVWVTDANGRYNELPPFQINVATQ